MSIWWKMVSINKGNSRRKIDFKLKYYSQDLTGIKII